MKFSSFLHFARFGVRTILLGRKDPILGTIILTDKCNLHCRHCSVNNLTAVIHPYPQILDEMRQLYQMGVRILFFCGGETFLWEDGGKTLRDLVVEAKAMGFLIVNVVTNGTFPLELPEADLILLSLDGDRDRHNAIRGDTYDLIFEHIRRAPADVQFAGGVVKVHPLSVIGGGDIAFRPEDQSVVLIVHKRAQHGANILLAVLTESLSAPADEDLVCVMSMVMVVMLMVVMVFVVMVVMMPAAHRTDVVIFRFGDHMRQGIFQRAFALNGFQDGLAGKLLPRRGNDYSFRVFLSEQRHRRGQFLFAHAARA